MSFDATESMRVASMVWHVTLVFDNQDRFLTRKLSDKMCFPRNTSCCSKITNSRVGVEERIQHCRSDWVILSDLLGDPLFQAGRKKYSAKQNKPWG